MVSILVVSIASPLLVGVYKNDKLIKKFEIDGKTSDILPLTYDKITKEFNIDKIYYVNGPGSYMSIKVSYIFLKTISIVEKKEFYSILGFELNNNSPIKALGKKYFKYINNEVKIELLNDDRLESFELPDSLENISFSKDTLPRYVLPAIE